ncbi:MAG: hypothetical protein IEMM0008_1096 [bacterium]|nr:MAG: hypothetical protein IEMM0008_1096 [bacterium]
MKKSLILILIGISISVYGHSDLSNSQTLPTDLKIPRIVDKSQVKRKRDIKLKILVYGSRGTTLVQKNASSNDNNNYSIGSQILYLRRFGDFLDFAFGLDLGYSQFYNLDAFQIDRKDKYVHSLFIIEITLWSTNWLGLSFQVGIGPFLGIEIDNGLGFMLGAGYEFRIHPQIVIPLRVRMDAIGSSGNTTSALSLMTGIAFYFDL